MHGPMNVKNLSKRRTRPRNSALYNMVTKSGLCA